MARCINKKTGEKCKFYITAEETGDQPGCADDGDITNPEEDVNCVAAGDEELEG